MLRENHECASLNREYGFYKKVEVKIIFIHGELSPSLKNLGQINEFIRPTEVHDGGLLYCLVSSDSESNLIELELNYGEVFYTFIERKIDNFLSTHNFGVLVRAFKLLKRI